MPCWNPSRDTIPKLPSSVGVLASLEIKSTYIFGRKNRDRLAFDTETVDRIAQAFENSSLKENGLDYLTECYEKLDSKAKSLCNFRYQQDLKPAQISDQMGMTPNLVAKALQRIRDRLRDCLERKKAAEVIL